MDTEILKIAQRVTSALNPIIDKVNTHTGQINASALTSTYLPQWDGSKFVDSIVSSDVSGATIDTINNAISAQNFLVENSGLVQYRTPAQVLVDIGAADSGVSGLTLQQVTDNGNTTTNNVTVNSLLVNGNLTVLGSATTINTEITTADAVIEMNDGEVGSGVTLGFSGLKIDRGAFNDFWMGFDETRDWYTIGFITGLTASEIDSTLRVATMADTMIDNGVAFWNSTNEYLETSSGITYTDYQLDVGILGSNTGSIRIDSNTNNYVIIDGDGYYNAGSTTHKFRVNGTDSVAVVTDTLRLYQRLNAEYLYTDGIGDLQSGSWSGITLSSFNNNLSLSDFTDDISSAYTLQFVTDNGNSTTNAMISTSYIQAASFRPQNMTTGYVSYYNGTDLANSVIFQSGTSVGIGTALPTHTLTVNGNTNDYIATFISSDTNAFISFQDDGTSNASTVYVGAFENALVLSGDSVRLTPNLLAEFLYTDSNGDILNGAWSGVTLSSFNNDLTLSGFTNDLKYVRHFVSNSGTFSADIPEDTLNIVGGVATSTSIATDTLTINHLGYVQTVTSGVISGDNWYRVCELNGGTGRGRVEFIMYSDGGSGQPFSIRGMATSSWVNTNSTLSIWHSSQSSIDRMRIVRNSTDNKSYIDFRASAGEDNIVFRILPIGEWGFADTVAFTNVTTLPSGDTVETEVNTTNVFTVAQDNVTTDDEIFAVDGDANVIQHNSTVKGTLTLRQNQSANFLYTNINGDVLNGSWSSLTAAQLTSITLQGVTDNGNTTTNEIIINGTNRGLIINDTDGTITGATPYIEFQASGSTIGQVGYTSGSDAQLYLTNSQGGIDILSESGSTRVYHQNELYYETNTGFNKFRDEIRTYDGMVGDLLVRLGDSADDGFVEIYQGGVLAIQLHGGASSDSFIDNGGGFGINTQTPSKPLHVVEASGGTGAGILLESLNTFGIHTHYKTSLAEIRMGVRDGSSGDFEMYNVGGGNMMLQVNSSGDTTIERHLYVPEYIYHSGDLDTFFRFTDNTINLSAGGSDLVWNGSTLYSEDAEHNLGGGSFYWDSAYLRQIFDVNGSSGATGQILSKSASGIDWADVTDFSASINYWSKTGTTVYYNGGNVGIGTNSASSPLEVNVTGNNTVLTLTRDNGVANGKLTISFPSAIATYDSKQGGHRWMYNGTEQMRLENNGRLGIGTDTPQHLLDINEGRVQIRTAAGSGGGINSHVLQFVNDFDTTWNSSALNAFNSVTSWDIEDRATATFSSRATADNIWTMANENTTGRVHSNRYVQLSTGSTAAMLSWFFFQWDGVGTTSSDFAIPQDVWEVQVRNGGVDERILNLSGLGQLTLDNYGIGAFSGTTTYRLGVDASGNVTEIPIGAGAIDGSGTTNYIPKWIDSDTLGDSAVEQISSDFVWDAGLNTFAGLYGDTTMNFKIGNGSGSEPRIYLYGAGNGQATAGDIFIGTANNTGTVQVNGDIYANGDVGIGTDSPLHELEVRSTSAAEIAINSATSNDAVLYFYENSVQTSKIGYDTSEAALSFVIGSGAFSTAQMVIDTTGVGIGTLSPNKQLEISDTGDTAIQITEGAAGGNVDVHYVNTNNNEGWKAGMVNTGVFSFSYASSLSSGIIGSSTRMLAINTDGQLTIDQYGTGTFSGGTTTFRLGVDASGNVTEIPIGAGAIDGSGTTNTIAIWTDSDTLGDSTIEQVSAGSININSYTASIGERGIFFRNGFDTPSNAYNLSILTYDHTNGGTTPDGLSINANDGVSFSTGGNTRNERMRINSAGNVGIGTSNPSAKLHIEGVTNTASMIKLINTAPVTDNEWRVHPNFNDQTLHFIGDTTVVLKLTDNGEVQLSEYGSGTFTGTTAYGLAVDATGNVIETANPFTALDLQTVTDNGAVTTNEITLPSIQFDTGQTITPTVGQIGWNSDDETLDLGLNGGSVVHKLGETMFFNIKAAENISKGDVLYASGAVGASSKIEASKFIANNSIEEMQVIGIAAEDIPIGEFGFVYFLGALKGISTDGSAVGETWTEGTILYASPTTGGTLTSTQPTAPNQAIPIAFVVNAHASNGTIYIRATQLGYHLGELHDVNDSGISDTEVLNWNNSNSRYEPVNLNDRYYTESEIDDFFAGNAPISGYNKTNWDTAYGWGDWSTGATLQTVTDNGNTTTNSLVLQSSAQLQHTSELIIAASTNIRNRATIHTFDNASGTTEYARFTSSGRLGIGISSPDEALHVIGAIKTNDELIVDDGTRGIRVMTDAGAFGSRSAIFLDIDSTDGIGVGSDYLAISQDSVDYSIISIPSTSNGGLYFRKGSTELMYLDNDGSLGIGTISPASKFHIQTTSGGAIFETTSGDFDFRFRESGVNKFNLAYIAADDSMTMYNNQISTHQMYWRSDGNVGIGTTVPDSKLHVQGDLQIGDNNDANGNLTLLLFSGERLVTNGTNTIDLKAASTAGASWGTSRIINTAPGSGDSLLQFATSKSNVITTRMTIDEDGNVGIGHTSPQEILDVNGNIQSRAAIPQFILHDTDNSAESKIRGAGGSMQFALSDTAKNYAFYGDNYSTSWMVLNSSGLTVDTLSGSGERVVFADANGLLDTLDSISTTELGYLDGVTSNIQTQINSITGSSLSIDNNADNRLLTATGGNNINAEANVTWDGSIFTINGIFRATEKSFYIDHPTKDNMKLVHGSLEGPEHGVYHRGKIEYGNVIELPDYWTGLVDEDTITVNITPMGKFQKIYVDKIENNKVYLKNGNLLDSKVSCHFTVYGERKDVNKLKVEIPK